MASEDIFKGIDYISSPVKLDSLTQCELYSRLGLELCGLGASPVVCIRVVFFFGTLLPIVRRGTCAFARGFCFSGVCLVFAILNKRLSITEVEIQWDIEQDYEG